jgi:hypothetical protein
MSACATGMNEQVLYSFLVICTFRISVADSLIVFLFTVLYWYDFTYWSFVYGVLD